LFIIAHHRCCGCSLISFSFSVSLYLAASGSHFALDKSFGDVDDSFRFLLADTVIIIKILVEIYLYANARFSENPENFPMLPVKDFATSKDVV